ncbi:MAG: hypothetical protein OYL97_22665 [Candidatus Poribacteria bacterium]|nr:hypothetical protein [Candidatus Poribacteria bacterium]
MIWKNFVIPILLVGMILLGMGGCGSNVEEPEELTEERPETLISEPSVSSVSKEKLLGSWDVVSIFGKIPEEFFEYTEDEEGVAEAETKTIEFRCAFADDNLWVWNFRQEIVFKDDADIPLGTIEMIGTWSGTYRVADLILSFILKESDTSVKSKPPGFFATLADLPEEVPEEEGRQRLAESFSEGFRLWILAPINKSTITRQEDTLTLTVSEAKKIIFEKQ